LRTRTNKWDKTPGGIKLAKIHKVVKDFPLLHAYGVGFGMFGCIPEQIRSQIIDYARYMLGYELDHEIDAALSFIKTLGGITTPHNENYVRSEYLSHLYATWRLEQLRAPERMPQGCFAVAALMINGSVRVVEALKPNFLVGIGIRKRDRLEEYLVATKGYQRWPDEKVFWSFARDDDRVDDKENKLRCVDAVECEKEEENG